MKPKKISVTKQKGTVKRAVPEQYILLPDIETPSKTKTMSASAVKTALSICLKHSKWSAGTMKTLCRITFRIL